MTELRDKLLDIVLSKGYERRDEAMRLSSGEMSHDFIDGKRALANGEDLELACHAILGAVAAEGIEFDAVGGLTLGADQFAHGVAIVGKKRWFVVRKERKGRGTNNIIEGAVLDSTTRVLLVDDIVTTGGSILQALDNIDEVGAVVAAAVTLCDRGDTAVPLFRSKGIPYLPLLTYHDLGIKPVGSGQVLA